jgi:hypothetical protein
MAGFLLDTKHLISGIRIHVACPPQRLIAGGLPGRPFFIAAAAELFV